MKKARSKGLLKVRRSWGMNPVTRVKKSAKVYARGRARTEAKARIYGE